MCYVYKCSPCIKNKKSNKIDKVILHAYNSNIKLCLNACTDFTNGIATNLIL